jgi:shikimate kinase
MIEQIFLIGYRAAGKTTIGIELAKKLDFEFLDTDQLLCKNRGAEVAEIVKNEGWEAFRSYEIEALQEAIHGDHRVVATGGGAVMHRQVWENVRLNALVVWLNADIETLAARLLTAAGDDASRPSLTGAAIHAEIENVLAERLPLYRKYADISVDTGKLSTAEAVDTIVDAYRARCGGSSR